MFRRLRLIRGAAFALLPMFSCALSGCQLSPEQQLHGRWFNTDMSIRFQPNGGVVFNSRAGRAEGRYFYDPQATPTANNEHYENLVLDVHRDGRRLRLGFQVDLIARDRLRIYDLNGTTATNYRGDRIYRLVILRRADDTTKTVSLADSGAVN
jgi:hypothetical protein